MNKITDISLGKLNNAEYTNMARRTLANIQKATMAKLGITQAQYDAYAANFGLMEDIVAQSRVSHETAQIALTDKDCDEIIVYLNATIKNGRKSPIAAQAQAATHLYNVTKPYIGIQNLAQGQQIQQTRGMLTDLGKDENADAIDTLSLGAVVQQLRQKNNQYANLIDTRAGSQTAAKLDSGENVRKLMDVQYDQLTTLAFVASIATPSTEADAFIVAQNKLIADTNTAYNQRVAQARANKKKKNENEE